MPNRHSSYISNGRARRPRRGVNPFVLFGLGIALIAIIIGIAAGIHFATLGTETFTVTDKNIKYVRSNDNKSDGEDVYMIYTDHGTFKDEDSIFAWKFNSSDLYGDLKVGQKYTCKTTGFRFGFGSSYKNLLSCK